MGNTVSAAEAVAVGITFAKAEPLAPPANHNTSGTPPPECPMHQKAAPPTVSECPMGHTGNDLNPLNMVKNLSTCHLLVCIWDF